MTSKSWPAYDTEAHQVGDKWEVEMTTTFPGVGAPLTGYAEHNDRDTAESRAHAALKRQVSTAQKLLNKRTR